MRLWIATGLLLFSLLPASLQAQCPNNNSLAFGAPQDLTPSAVGNTRTNVQIWGGEYATVNVVTGNNYTISTCTDLSGINTILSLYNEGTGVLQAFNDDFCGIRSQINYTATFTGVLRVLLDESPGCGSNGTNQTMTVTLNSVACSAPTIATHPGNAIVCPGASATFTSSASGTPDSLRWFRSTDGGTTWLRIFNGAPYSGTTTGTLTVNPASAGISGTRYRLSAFKCSGPVQSVNSNAAILTSTDATPPTAICRNITRNLSSTTASITPTDINNGSTDNCGTVNLASVSPSAFTCANIGSNTVTLTINDGNGNTATCTGTVTIADITPPTAICRNISRPLSGTTASITPTDINNGSTDNCGTVNLASASPSSFTCANIGTNNVTLTVNDGHGNTATCIGVVTISDTTRPNITCPANINTSTNAGSCTATGVALGSPTASDNCTAAPGTSNNGPASYPAGSTNVTWTAIDASGNSRTCIQTVTVADLITPVAVCQNRTVNLNAGGTGSVSASLINNGSSDNCGIASLNVAPASFTCANLGANPVTLTVTDNAGNTATCSATVTVADAIAPTAICQSAVTIYLNASGNATLATSQINNGSTDNCAVASTSLNKTTFTCANLGANTVTLSVTDASGNIGTCNATATVADTTDPNTICQNITVFLSPLGMASITAASVDAGSTDNCAVNSRSATPTTFTCANVGTNTVVLTVNDPSGNSRTCNATVTIMETNAPDAVCVSSATVYLNASGSATPTAALIDGGSGDNCGIVSHTFSPSSFNCGDLGVVPVTMTVADASGNSASCATNVMVIDTVSPSAFCQNITASLDAAGSANVATAQIDNGSADACGVASLVLSQTAFTCAHIGANSVTLTVTDNVGNVATCAATVTVVDNTAPSAVCQPVTLILNAAGTASTTAAAVNNGSTDNCAVASTTLSQTAFTCANLGTNSVTLTVADASANSGTCTATVTVVDNTAPSAVCQNATLTLNAAGTASLTPTMVNNGSTDNCAVASTTLSQTAFTCAHVGANTVTLTVSDASSNSSTCTATISVVDNTAPSAICQPVTLNLDAAGSANLASAQVNNGSTDNCSLGALVLSQTAFTCAHLGANSVTLTVNDVNGNNSTCAATVTVVDNTAPSAVCQPVTLTLDAAGTASTTAAAVNNGSTDNCAVASTTLSQTAFTCAHLGTNSVTLTVADASTNSSTCTAAVTVVDNTAPNAVCQNATLTLNAAGTASLTPTMVNNGSTDNCAVASTTLSQTAFTCANVGTNTATLTVADASSNSSTCTATITVVDNTAPSAVCQPVTLNLDAAGSANLASAQVNNGSSDNCSLGALVLSQTAFTCAHLGTNSVTLTVNDVNGNNSTCAATVTVVDNTAPSAVCQPVTLTLDAAGTASTTAAAVNNGSTDNCGVGSTTLSQTAFTCAHLGTNSVTLTVADASSNTGTCTAVVTVVDNTAPSAVCQNATLTLDAAGSANLSPTMVNNGSTDNCAVASTTLSQTAFTCANVGANTVTLTVSDASSNTSTCTATITIVDNTAPSAVCQPVTLNLDAAGSATLASAQVNNGSSDNCSLGALVLSQTAFTCAHLGTNSVTLTVNDVNGNNSTCSATVTVVDNTAPGAVCQPVTLTLDAAGTASTTAAAVNNGSTDNCAVASTTLSQTAFTCAHLGTNSVTLTVADASSNTGTCTAVVTVVDNTAPSAVCQNATLTLDAAGSANLTPTMVNNGSTDNCAVASTTLSQTAFTCANVGTNTVTLTVADASSNTSTCTATITVVDNTAPSAICQPVTLNLDAAGSANLASAQIDNGSSDNCGIDTLALSQDLFFCSNIGSNTVTLTVADASGNTSTCTAVVTVHDSLAATAVCQPLTLLLDANGTASILDEDLDGGSSDNCGIATLVASQTTFTCIDVPSVSVTLTIVDLNGNTSACSTTVTVLDTVAPTAVCQNITLYLDATGNANTSPSAVDNGSSDGCAVTGLTLSQNSFFCADLGTNTVTLTVSDGSGNTSTCIATVTVLDTLAPSAVCQPDTVQLDAAGSGSTSASAVDNGSADNCAFTSTLSQTNFTCADIGPNTVTLTVADSSGNSSSCTATVIVEDNLGPITLCQDITVQLGVNGSVTITASQIDNGSTDNCGIDSLSLNLDTFTCSDIGVNTVILSATDASGNLVACAAIVTVVDPNPLPIVTFINDTLWVTGNFAAIQWLQSGAIIPGAILPYYVPTTSGTYSVQVTDLNGCTRTSADTSIIVTSVRDGMMDDFGLSIYPNPTRDHLYLQAEKVVTGQVVLQITDMHGRILYSQDQMSLSSRTRIELPALANGMYLLRVRHAENGNATFKFVVE